MGNLWLGPNRLFWRPDNPFIQYKLGNMAPTKPRPPVQVIDSFLTQQDILSALVVWIILEGFSFILLPNFTLISGENKTLTWVLITTPLGIAGSIIIGICSSCLQYCHVRLHKADPKKKLLVAFANMGSWLGLAGIGFPLIVVGLEFWLLIVHGIDS
ncbi:hypothetical protein HRE53_02870 [Acaryochloris sp. 'Moss Beach']|nr:hypothetical protein I1H34_16700 [Acaryochloris marina S15]UJB70107.1 hypothetical protein HRE53_02870 [Acaryochloris sp. 'Moss Beach']